jgi:TfoX/Sxy family transcriptional regulator of competence genes
MTAETDLASRVRAALEGVEAVREVKMFGGVGFMVNGNLVAAASGRGLLLRIGRERQDEALAQPGIRPMEMRGRRMDGYVYADPPPRSEEAIKAWLRSALDYVQTLPPKPVEAAAKRTKRQVK